MEHATIERLKLEALMEDHAKRRSAGKENVSAAVGKRKEVIEIDSD